MLGESTAQCPICGRPYKVYSHYAGDQSACGQCRAFASGPGDPVTYPSIPFGNPRDQGTQIPWSEFDKLKRRVDELEKNAEEGEQDGD